MLISQAEEILATIKPIDSGISLNTTSANMQSLQTQLLDPSFSIEPFMPPHTASSTIGHSSQSTDFTRHHTASWLPDNTVIPNVSQTGSTQTTTAVTTTINYTVATTAPVVSVTRQSQPVDQPPNSSTVQRPNLHVIPLTTTASITTQQFEANYLHNLITTLRSVNNRPADPLNQSIQELLTQEIARQINRNIPVSTQPPIFSTSVHTSGLHTPAAQTVQATTAPQWQMPPPFMYPNYYTPYMYQAQQPQQPRVDPIFAKTEMPKINSKNTEQSIAKLEEWLLLNGVTDDDRKYSALKMQLDSSTYTQVGNVLYHPPETGKFDALKKAVIKVFTDSETKRMQNLIDGLQLGDKKPSQLLTEMRNLHRGNLMDDTIFRQLWMKRLPSNVTSVLGALTKTLNANTPPPTLEQLAEAADSIMENAQSSSNSINSIANKSNDTSHVDDLHKTIQSLNEQVKWLTLKIKGQQSGFRSRSRSRSQGRTAAVSAPEPANVEKSADAEPTPCSYHKKHGYGEHKNRKCFPDCPLFEEWCKAHNYKPKNG